MKILACVYNEIDYDGRVQRAAEALSTLGEVTVLCVDSGLEYRNQVFSTTKVRRIGSGRLRHLTHLVFWLKLWRIALTMRPKVVHAHDYFMAFPGWLAAKLSGAKLIYDAHELVIPEPNEHTGRRQHFWYWLEYWTVKRANLVIAANEDRAGLMAQHYRLAKCPLVIRNISPLPQQCLTDKDVLQQFPLLAKQSANECLLAYQGDMNLERGIGVWIEALASLPNTFRLVLIGSGPGLKKVMELVQRLGLQGRVVSTGRVPKDQLCDLLRQCDVGIVTYPFVGLNNRYCASNKVFEYAQSGLPIVATSQRPLRTLVEEYGIGELVEEGDEVTRVAEALRTVGASCRGYRKALGRFLTDHRWEDEAERLRGAVVEL